MWLAIVWEEEIPQQCPYASFSTSSQDETMVKLLCSVDLGTSNVSPHF